MSKQYLDNSKTKQNTEVLNLDSLFKSCKALQPMLNLRKVIKPKPSKNPSIKINSRKVNPEKGRMLISRTNNNFQNKSTAADSNKQSMTLNSLGLNCEERSSHYDYSALNNFLIQRMKDLDESTDYLEVFLDIFDEVIFYDKRFGVSLRALRNKLEKLIKNLRHENENIEKNQKILIALKKSLEMENHELKESYHKLHKEFSEISEKYYKVSKVELRSEEITLDSLKKLKQENIVCKDYISKLKRNLDYYKTNFYKIVKVVDDKGIDVGKIFIKEVPTEKPLRLYTGKSELESCTEYEYMVSIREKENTKPPDVPLLKIFDAAKGCPNDSEIFSLSNTE